MKRSSKAGPKASATRENAGQGAARPPSHKRGLPDLQASIEMASHYLAVVEALRRVRVALGPTALVGQTQDPEEIPHDDPVLWAWDGGHVMLSSDSELAAWYSPKVLREMAARLEACVQEHHKAMLKGYGDALRAESKQRIVRWMHQAFQARSKRAVNGLISGATSNGKPNESSVRKMLRRKSKWTVLDVEPRAFVKHREGTGK